jgi:hypothetical protein
LGPTASMHQTQARLLGWEGCSDHDWATLAAVTVFSPIPPPCWCCGRWVNKLIMPQLVRDDSRVPEGR